MSPTSWWISTGLIFLLGAFGAFFAVKEFFDPEFSDWLSPGPGQALLGDAGRMLMFEAGPNGIQTKLLGVQDVQANTIEGILLGLGSIGMLASPFRSNMCQFVTCVLLPLEACYYLVNIIYFALVRMPEAAAPMLGLGGGLLALSFWRLETSLQKVAPSSTKLVLNLYMVYFLITVLVALNMVRLAPVYAAELELFVQVRDFFLKENGMTWTKGLEFPNGFYIKTE